MSPLPNPSRLCVLGDFALYPPRLESRSILLKNRKPTMDPKPPVSYDDFAKLDLRVAKVLAAREHPNANKLLLLQIQVGDVEKQIVAGIRGHTTSPTRSSAARS
jgi:Putative tRNA binding domain